MSTDVYYNVSDNRDNITAEKEVEFVLYHMYDYKNDIKLNFQTFKNNVISVRETGCYILFEHGGLLISQFSELCDAYEYFSACKAGIKEAQKIVERFSVDKSSTLNVKVNFFVKERLLHTSNEDKSFYKGKLIPQTKNEYHVILANEENLNSLKNIDSEINKQIENSLKKTCIHPKNNPNFTLENWNEIYKVIQSKKIMSDGIVIFEKEIFSSSKGLSLNEDEISKIRKEVAEIPFYI